MAVASLLKRVGEERKLNGRHYPRTTSPATGCPEGASLFYGLVFVETRFLSLLSP